MTKEQIAEREEKISKILAELIAQRFTGYHIELAMSKIVDLIGAENRKAISEHEAGKWRKYPQEKPENGSKWFVQNEHNEQATARYSNGNWYLFETMRINLIGIIAFRELPEPYKPE